MNKLIIAAVATVATVAVTTLAHRKGWLPESVSSKISKAAAATKNVFTKKADVVTPEKGDTTHAAAPAAEEVKPAPEAANGPSAEAPAAADKAAA